MMASRLLIDKGVVEFYEAAVLLKHAKLQANFVLVGETDSDNPASISDDLIEKWMNENIVEFWGHRADMQNVLPKASMVVLPSYREGFPKVLIEAAACGRPVITTDVPGCRDAIYNKKTGILVPPRNAKALADAIKNLILDNDTRQMMGSEARKMSETRFDERMVIKIKLDNGLIIYVVQIAGLIARRIKCDLEEGKIVKAGEKFGIIRFGSRVDVYLPMNFTLNVLEGQTIIGGETVLANQIMKLNKPKVVKTKKTTDK